MPSNKVIKIYNTIELKYKMLTALLNWFYTSLSSPCLYTKLSYTLALSSAKANQLRERHTHTVPSISLTHYFLESQKLCSRSNRTQTLSGTKKQTSKLVNTLRTLTLLPLLLPSLDCKKHCISHQTLARTFSMKNDPSLLPLPFKRKFS